MDKMQLVGKNFPRSGSVQMDICNLPHLRFLCQTAGPKNVALRQQKGQIYRL